MKKLFFFFLLSVVISCTSLTRPVIAQNKAGINIGTKYGDTDRAISTVGAGGWLVVIAGGTGDCNNLQGIIDRTNAASVNLIIRGHLGNKLSANDAKAWAATLGQIRTTNKIYFMPWNEPNQEGSNDYGDPGTVSGYCRALKQALDESGVSGKIFLLSPMLNQSHPNFNSYAASLGSGFFSIFNGIALNLYDFSEQICGSPLCAPDAHFNPARYGEILNILGTSGKLAFGVESGTAGDNFYFKQPPNSNSPLYRFVQAFFPRAPEMFAIPSYDLAGEVGHSWSLFNPPDTANLISSQTKGGTTGANFNQGTFDAWLKALTTSGELVSCNSCGFAHQSNKGLCSGTGGGSLIPLDPSKNCNLNSLGSTADQKTSRPVPCEDCNRTNDLTSSCAQSFQINDQVKYRRGDSNNSCEGNIWVEKNWEGTVSVDPKGVIIPFVGKKGDENRQKYLADYFEGTCPYYGDNSPCPSDPTTEDVLGGKSPIGIWQYYAPRELQDSFKKEMVRRAIESKSNNLKLDKIRDYVVNYKGDSLKLSEFDGHFPPTEVEDPDGKKRLAWENTRWGILWPAVPMFTREDTPGKIVPYLGAGIKDSFEIQDKDTTTIEKVPHLARLFEVTKAINQLLMPAPQTDNTGSIDGPIIASSKENPSKEVTLLAEASCQKCLVPNIVDPYVFAGNLHYTLSICFSCMGDSTVGDGTVGDVYMGACGNANQVHSVSPNCFSSSHESVAPPVPISCPGTASICASTRANRDVNESCKGQFISTNCQVSVDANCKVISSTCGAAPPPKPICGLPKPQPVDTCEKPSITGQGDTLCCSEIVAKVSATDQFINASPASCSTCIYDPITGGFIDPGCDACNDILTQDVTRKVGVSLSHPYLKTIWDNTTNIADGFWNIWRMGDTPKFESTDASSRVKYNYTSASGKASLNPNEGDFYFPYLGGIQRAKEQVIKTILPATGNSTGIVPRSTVISSDQIGYSIDVTNINQTIKPETRTQIINLVKISWPNSKIEQNWDFVFQKAKQMGFNPVLVLAIWIEESGASGVNAYDLGVEACNPNDLANQLECFSTITYKNDGFEEFMCMFAEGKHHVCKFERATNFVKNLKYWYDELVK